MRLLDRLFGGSTGSKQEPVVTDESRTIGIWVAHLTYEDESKESVEFMNMSEGDRGYRFFNEINAVSDPGPSIPRAYADVTFVPYSTLTRRPQIQQIGRCNVEYKLKHFEKGLDRVQEVTDVTKTYRDQDPPGIPDGTPPARGEP